MKCCLAPFLSALVGSFPCFLELPSCRLRKVLWSLKVWKEGQANSSPWFPLDHSGDFVLLVPFSSNQGSAWFPWFSPGYGLNSNPASAESSENTKAIQNRLRQSLHCPAPASASLTSGPGRSSHCQRGELFLHSLGWRKVWALNN